VLAQRIELPTFGLQNRCSTLADTASGAYSVLTRIEH